MAFCLSDRRPSRIGDPVGDRDDMLGAGTQVICGTILFTSTSPRRRTPRRGHSPRMPVGQGLVPLRAFRCIGPAFEESEGDVDRAPPCRSWRRAR